MSGNTGTQVTGQTLTSGSFVQSYTAADLIRLALLNSGAVSLAQTIYAEDTFAGFDLLNGMLAIWSRKRWLIWHLLDIAATTVNGLRQYSIGPGGNFDVPRPDRLEGAYFRQFVQAGGQPVDFPLDLLESMEDYAQAPLKYLTSWPRAVFYDAAFPMGQILPVPIPNVANSELHVLIKDTLNQFPTVTTPVNLPPEYFEAIWTNLAIRLGGIYPGVEITPRLAGLARAALETIRGANVQIPRLRIPLGLGRRPMFNIYAGPGQPGP